MYRLLLILIMFINIDFYAQNLDFIKSQDTLFIIGQQLTRITPTSHSYNRFDLTRYSNGIISEYVIHKKNNMYQNIFISIRLNPQKPVEDLPIVVNRKKFLKENKKRILDFKFIGKYTIEEFFFKTLGLTSYSPLKREVYIIDEESLKRKDKEIILRKATIVAVGFMRI